MTVSKKWLLNLNKVDSPLGKILVVTKGSDVCALDFADHEQRMRQILQSHYGDFSLITASDSLGICDRIQAYFSGNYESLATISVNPRGTPFQQKVWSRLREIPVGKTLTYGELAMQLGNPNASRAVGMANSRNPVAIVIPCHRVIGANAKLTGYAGGLARKQWLLKHEGVALADTSGQLPLPFGF